MDLNLDAKKLEAAIISEAANQILDAEGGAAFTRLLDGVRKSVEARIDKIFAETADAAIQNAVAKAIQDGFEKEYCRVNQWGKPEGKPTTIAKELSRVVSGYWNEKVDSNGKPTDSSYSSMTRAEFVMLKVCGDDFSARMKDAALNVTGALKDGLRNQMAQQMDRMLDGLFHVKSLQDQGKVEKPY